MVHDKAYREAEKTIEEARCSYARELSLRGMTALPESLAQLTQLQKLDLSYNQLTALPDSLAQLSQLEMLGLCYNQLTALPDSLAQLTQLWRLYLSDNQLTGLSEALGQLTQLKSLDLSYNQLTALPDSLGQLTQLQELDLNNNQLTALPASLGKLTKLHSLRLYGNPLIDPPPAVVARGIDDVMVYLATKLEQGDRPQWRSKTILVGEAGVGKTSLLRALRGEPFRKDEKTTHGLQVIPLPRPHPDIDGQEMDLACWDFGGQHVLHATHQFFLTDRSLFVLVWNARVGWEQSKLYYWLDVIQATDKQAPVLIVATHTEDWPARLPWEDIREKYPQVLGQFLVSNRQRDPEAFARLFSALDKAAAGLPMMGQQWPVPWLDAAEALAKREKKEKTITPKQFHGVLRKQKVKEEDCLAVARHLHALGDVLDFRDKDDAALRNTVILDAEWIAERISHMLADEDIAENKGIFTRNCMKNVWPGISWETRDLFLGLMEQFDLSFRTLEQEDISYVVEHLPLDPPDDVDALWDTRKGEPEVAMTYRFAGSLPPGIPTWFIARSHRFTSYKHWRYGALLKYGGETLPDASHLALIHADDHQRFVSLKVRGPEPINFFAQLRATFELTLGRYKNLVYDRKVPCPGCSKEFDFELLQKRLWKKRYDEYCEKCDKEREVRQLLFGLVPGTQDEVQEKLKELLANQQTMLAQHDEQTHALTIIRKQNDQIRQLVEHQHHDFMAQFRHLEQSKLDTLTPRLFLLGPEQQGRWSEWLPTAAAGWKALDQAFRGKRLQLRLLCEAPGCWHTLEGDAGVYDIRQPAKWLQEAAPLVRGVADVLAKTLPAVAAAADYSGGLGAASVTSTGALAIAKWWADDLEFMAALIEALPEIDESREGLLVRKLEEEAEAGITDWTALTALRALLTERDPKGVEYGLTRIVMETNDIYWVCEEHYNQFKRREPRFTPLPPPNTSGA